jgi:hypothetical protein
MNIDNADAATARAVSMHCEISKVPIMVLTVKCDFWEGDAKTPQASKICGNCYNNSHYVGAKGNGAGKMPHV